MNGKLHRQTAANFTIERRSQLLTKWEALLTIGCSLLLLAKSGF